jgi:hypothetical protein
VVLPFNAFVRQIHIAIGERSILAVSFSIQHPTNTITKSMWYGQPNGTTHSPLKTTVTLNPCHHREFCAVECTSFQSLRVSILKSSFPLNVLNELTIALTLENFLQQNAVDIDKAPSSLCRLRWVARLRSACVPLRACRDEAQIAPFRAEWQMKLSATPSIIKLSHPATALSASATAASTTSRAVTTEDSHQHMESATKAPHRPFSAMSTATTTKTPIPAYDLSPEGGGSAGGGGRARGGRPVSAPPCTKSGRAVERAFGATPPGIVTIQRTGLLNGVVYPVMEVSALLHRTNAQNFHTQSLKLNLSSLCIPRSGGVTVCSRSREGGVIDGGAGGYTVASTRVPLVYGNPHKVCLCVCVHANDCVCMCARAREASSCF